MAKKTASAKNKSTPIRQAPSKARKPSAPQPSRFRWLRGFLRGKLSAKPAPSKPAVNKTPPRSSVKTPQPQSGLSLDRKLDILGVVMALSGFLSILSMVSLSQGWLTNRFLQFLEKNFGWGAFLLPLGFLLIGIWLIVRNFDRVPTLSMERLVGILLLYLNILTWFHVLYLVFQSSESAHTLQIGQGGGQLGAWLFQFLMNAFGAIGAAIALVSWLIIAVILTFDIQLTKLIELGERAMLAIQDWVDETRARRANGSATPRPMVLPPAPAPPTKGSTPPPRPLPIQRPSANLPTASTPASAALSTELTAWQVPNLSEILEPGSYVEHNEETDQRRAHVIEETLRSFGAPAHIVEIHRGPVITQFGVEPDFIETRTGRMRVRVGKIASLADDLALALSARTVRIQAPVPGKGYVGIEVPNEQPAVVSLRDVIESEAFQRLHSPLRFALGQDVAGSAVAVDLAAMPHLLIAGTTGSGKSVCVNSLISCLLLHNTPHDLRLIMVDPKRVELSNYNGIPHLLSPVVVELERVVSVLQWVTREMDQRYHKLAQAGTRNISEYNALLANRGERQLPYLVVIIDELADLMMLAPEETERTLTRLAQLARATGIHLVIATQRPSVDVVTGLIKANFPARVAFAVASGVDSRVILDQPGAERLLGRGDMLFQAPDAPAPIRLQGTFVSDVEIQRLVEFWQMQAYQRQPASSTAMSDAASSLPSGVPLKQIPLWEEIEEANQDPLLNEAIDLARRQGRASISMLQRRLRIGYTRAARLVETMEEKGIVGPPQPGTGTREILDYGNAAPPADDN
ncbi:MAG: DNA translocase FtsK 4TM domain-containing protein [Chloroflexota bacterium]